MKGLGLQEPGAWVLFQGMGFPQCCWQGPGILEPSLWGARYLEGWGLVLTTETSIVTTTVMFSSAEDEGQ